MTIKTKLVALGAIGAAAYGVARALRHRAASSDLDVDTRFDASDVEYDEIIVADDQGVTSFEIVSRVTG